jgi:hypothetical protein
MRSGDSNSWPATLWLSKNRNEVRALHFEAGHLCVSPRRTMTLLAKQPTWAVIQRNTDVLSERVVRPAVSGIDGVRRLRGDAIVAVVQSADFWDGDDATG